MIRVLQLADVVNRYDFIDSIVRNADPSQFEMSVCVRTSESNIADPQYGSRTSNCVLDSTSKWTLPLAVARVCRLLREWRIDVLHTHHYDQALIGWMATRLWKKTRLVVGRHYSDSLYRLRAGAKFQVLLQLEQLANRAASRIIVPSTMIRDILCRRQGIGADKIDVIPYGFVPEKYAPAEVDRVHAMRDKLGIAGKTVIGCFGRLHEEKGHRHLLKAITELKHRYPNLLLVIAGDGPERRAIEQQIQVDGLDSSVVMVGWRRDVMPLMAAVDFVVQPTLQEAFSQVMAESMWMQRALVITDVSGATDVIRHGVNGLIVPRADSGSLAKAIELLANDAALRDRLAAAGKHYVETHLVVDKIVPRYEEAYRRAVGAMHHVPAMSLSV